MSESTVIYLRVPTQLKSALDRAYAIYKKSVTLARPISFSDFVIKTIAQAVEAEAFPS